MFESTIIGLIISHVLSNAVHFAQKNFKYIINKSCTTAINIDPSHNKQTTIKPTSKNESNLTFPAPGMRVSTRHQNSPLSVERKCSLPNSPYRTLCWVLTSSDPPPSSLSFRSDTSSIRIRIRISITTSIYNKTYSRNPFR